ncbi:MAG: hypothetical protein ACMUJM_18395 [bacterium]
MRDNNSSYKIFIILIIFFTLTGSITYCNALILESTLEKIIVIPEPPSIDIERIAHTRNNEPFETISLQDIYASDFKVQPIRYAMNSEQDTGSWEHTWEVNINNKTFHIYIDRDEEKVIIKGRVDYLDEKEEVERVIKMRAPSTYTIVNEIM